MGENKKPEFENEFEAIEQRGKTYGDAKINFDAVGMAWAGILSIHLQLPVEAIPGHVVAAMMATFKSLRSVGPAFHMDNYVDEKAYCELSKLVRMNYENIDDRE